MSLSPRFSIIRFHDTSQEYLLQTELADVPDLLALDSWKVMEAVGGDDSGAMNYNLFFVLFPNLVTECKMIALIEATRLGFNCKIVEGATVAEREHQEFSDVETDPYANLSDVLQMAAGQLENHIQECPSCREAVGDPSYLYDTRAFQKVASVKCSFCAQMLWEPQSRESLPPSLEVIEAIEAEHQKSCPGTPGAEYR